MNAEIINPDNLPESFILAEIEQIERERGRTVAKAEFHRVGEDQATERFWWVPVKFDRIRRITGYLVGTTERFNDAKKAEEKDRVKHAV